MTMTITEQLAEALRILAAQVKPYEDGDGAAMYHAQNIARNALSSYDANRAEPRPAITDEQIHSLGERFGFGTPVEDGFIWFDGNPSDMIRAALDEFGG